MDSNLYLKQIEVGPMANFVYLIGDRRTKEVFLVDPAWQIDTIFKTAEKEGLNIVGALVTHGHFDHCNGLDELLAKKDIPIYVQEKEAEFVKGKDYPEGLFGELPQGNLKKVRSGDKVQAGDIEITFLHTPGHTPGSQCFLVKDNLISGDTLFIRGCGRCDFSGSDPKAMYESLTLKLMKLPDDTVLFPGHNYADEISSKLADEKKKNPYLICDSLDLFLNMVGAKKMSSYA